MSSTTNPVNTYLVIAVVALGALVLSGERGCQSINPTPAPSPIAGPDMVKAFATNDNRTEAVAHARALETILSTCADVLEYDGTRKEPRIKTGGQVEDLRFALREYRMKGWSFGYRYPDLKDELDRWFVSQVSDRDHPIDPPKREAWIRAFRTARDACRQAQDRG